jgi:carboxymethylenebutenolidase
MPAISQDSKFTTRDGKTYDVRLSVPEGSDKHPAILFMPAIFGVDDTMKLLIESYANEGFLVAAPDYFFRTVPGPESNLEKAFARMHKHDIEQGVRDMEDTIEKLRKHDLCNGKVMVLGFCFGGIFAYLSAVRLNVDAIATFHGTRIHSYLDEADKLTVPASLHYGDKDPIIPMEQVENIQVLLGKRDNCEVIVHKGGEHNFSMPGKPGYNEKIAMAARNSVLKCFRSV